MILLTLSYEVKEKVFPQLRFFSGKAVPNKKKLMSLKNSWIFSKKRWRNLQYTIYSPLDLRHMSVYVCMFSLIYHSNCVPVVSFPWKYGFSGFLINIWFWHYRDFPIVYLDLFFTNIERVFKKLEFFTILWKPAFPGEPLNGEKLLSGIIDRGGMDELGKYTVTTLYLKFQNFRTTSLKVTRFVVSVLSDLWNYDLTLM